MSRSRKHPVFKGSDKYYKKLSNKRIRKWIATLDVGFKSKRQFKQQVNPWDICDWKYVVDKTNKKLFNKAKRK